MYVACLLSWYFQQKQKTIQFNIGEEILKAAKRLEAKYS